MAILSDKKRLSELRDLNKVYNNLRRSSIKGKNKWPERVIR